MLNNNRNTVEFNYLKENNGFLEVSNVLQCERCTWEKRQSELWVHAGQLDGELRQVDAVQGRQGAVRSIQNISRLLLYHPLRVRTQLGLQHLHTRYWSFPKSIARSRLYAPHLCVWLINMYYLDCVVLLCVLYVPASAAWRSHIFPCWCLRPWTTPDWARSQGHMGNSWESTVKCFSDASCNEYQFNKCEQTVVISVL